MTDDFYKAFEEKHRGSRALILSRLAVYRSFTSLLQEIYPESPAVDLGCGRGEWIETLLDEGFLPMGIDQNEGMLQSCRDLGLPARQGDAVAYLATLPDESQAIISAFHLVEHISFDQVRTVVSEALRVLKPGGLLIMETPNPENIVVATRNFYLDPTHLRPIPPQLLSFLPDYYGFPRTKILRLQESRELLESASPTLNDIFAGASPDYAVIAQKAASAETLAIFDDVFDKEYGLTLNTLASRYDEAITAKVEQAEAKAEQAEAKAEQAEAKAEQAEAKAEQAKAKAKQSKAKAEQAELGLNAIYSSSSWRISAPLRWVVLQFRLLCEYGPKARTKALLRKIGVPLLCNMIAFINSSPWLRKKLVAVARKSGAEASLMRFYCKFRQILGRQPPGGADTQNKTFSTSLEQLSPRASRIYADLKIAVNQKKRDN